jgi:hypothetical protein
MQWYNYYRMRFPFGSKIMAEIVLLGFISVIILGGNNAKADFIWGTPTRVPNVNSSAQEFAPEISADGLSMYFSSNRPRGYGDYDIYVATRETIHNDWGTPVNLGSPPNSRYGAIHPSITADGLELYFSDTHVGNWHPGGYGDGDVWVAIRETTEDAFEPYMNLGPQVNGQNAWFADVSGDGLELYITSHRSGSIGNCDIWLSTRKTRSEPFGAPTHLGSNVNSGPPDGAPEILFDGLTLIFERGPGPNGSDIWMARRTSTSEPFGPAVKLPDHVNSPYGEWGGQSLSPNGSTLYFSSNRHGNHSEFDIWQAPIIPIVDFNNDGIVDAADVCIMVDNWGSNEPLCDIGPMPWGDGIVDVQDLMVLSEYLFEEINDPTLVAHWALDETEGMFAVDSVGDNDAVIVGGTAWQPGGGQVDGALQLDGNDGCAIAESVLNPANGSFSVFAWTKGGAPGQVVFSQSNATNWLMADSDMGCLTTELMPPAVGRFTPQPLKSESVITDGQWHRIGFVWDGANRTLYMNDVLVAEDSQANLQGSDDGLYIGTGKAMEPGTFWSGLIDDVRIYNRAVRP